ncbi:MAG: hypothetical protein COA86_04225 [Kangiella sp.]|nr:MAG: hypothetical protein COA86_04225 [Kangiella sp.]
MKYLLVIICIFSSHSDAKKICVEETDMNNIISNSKRAFSLQLNSIYEKTIDRLRMELYFRDILVSNQDYGSIIQVEEMLIESANNLIDMLKSIEDESTKNIAKMVLLNIKDSHNRYSFTIQLDIDFDKLN